MSVIVNISGTAFSLLLYENVRNECDQEGFLLGEVITNEKRTITDNDQEVVTIEHAIKINSVLPCPRLGFFFDNAGQINAQKIDRFVDGAARRDSIVSWYKFKRTSSFKLSLREKIVMKQLAVHFMPSAPERFTCCLLTSQIGSEPGATHIFSQTFIRYHKSAYVSLPMHIINLKDPHDVYKDPERASKLFGDIVRGLRLNQERFSQSGYATIDAIETALDEHIGKVVEKLHTSEAIMHELEARVEELRRKINVLEDDEGEARLDEEGETEAEDATDTTTTTTATVAAVVESIDDKKHHGNAAESELDRLLKKYGTSYGEPPSKVKKNLRSSRKD